MTLAGVPRSPYKGLIPYAEEDAPFFFGRESEREVIGANLIASRLTLLYGSSGVGKSSVLQAGVVHDFRMRCQREVLARAKPDFVVIAMSAWRDDPVQRLATRMAQEFDALGSAPAPSGESSASLVQILGNYADMVHGSLLIILDQFEEYFLYHPQEGPDRGFASELAQAINRPELRAHFLISIREDTLAQLDRFKGRVPNLFSNYLRIDHLNNKAAHDAIVRPIEQYNTLLGPADHPIAVEAELIERVLAQIQAGRVTIGQTGLGSVKRGDAEPEHQGRVETPYLQVVMTRVWDEEMRLGSRKLRVATLTHLGGAEQIVRTHLDVAMSTLTDRQQYAAARMFHYLVTPSGTKIAHTVGDLADYSGMLEEDAAPVLNSLSGARIVRTVPPLPDHPDDTRYEIFHDVLAAGILDWRNRFVQSPFRISLAVKVGVVTGLALSALLLFVLLIRNLAVVQITSTSDFQGGAMLLGLAAQAAGAVFISLRVRRWHWLYCFVMADTTTAVMILFETGRTLLFHFKGDSNLATMVAILFLVGSVIGGSLCAVIGLATATITRWAWEVERHRQEIRGRRIEVLVMIVGRVVLLVAIFWSCVGATSFIPASAALVISESASRLVFGANVLGVVVGAVAVAWLWGIVEHVARYHVVVVAGMLVLGGLGVTAAWANDYLPGGSTIVAILLQLIIGVAVMWWQRQTTAARTRPPSSPKM